MAALVFALGYTGRHIVDHLHNPGFVIAVLVASFVAVPALAYVITS